MTVNALAIDPSAPARLFAGTNAGVFGSTSGGTTWIAANTGLTATTVSVLAIDPSTPARLFAGTNAGVFGSTSGGTSWISVNSGLTATTANALAINLSTPTTLYAGTSGGGVFRSTNGGTSWAAVNSGLTNTDVYSLAIDPSTPATLYAGTAGGGVFKSTDGGTSWTAINSGLTLFELYGVTPVDVCALAIDPSTPATLYAGVCNAGIVFKTTNGGTSWTAANSGLPIAGVLALAIDPSTPSTLYAGMDQGDYRGVFKSTNGGTSWSAASSGLTRWINALAIDPSTPATLYAGNGLSYGAYKTTNGGDSWTLVNSGLDYVFALAIDPSTPSTLYAGTSPFYGGGGVFKSTNGGTSWIAASSGLTNTFVLALAIDPSTPATLYAATYGSGVFKSTNGGASWQPTSSTAAPPVLPAPAVSAVSPSSGPTAGGTAVTVTGTNFAAGASVTIGGTAATVFSVTATTITVTTPTHAAGAANVVVCNPDGQTGTLTGGFTFSDTPPVETPPDRGDLPEDPGQACPTPATKAVLITHGWTDNAGGWVKEMAEKLCTRLSAGSCGSSFKNDQLTRLCQANSWDVWILDWKSNAKDTGTWLSPNPMGAYVNAIDVGEDLASNLKLKNYSHIHFIAHSAGANLIDFATIWLKYWVTKESRPALEIHETFLDAYDPVSDPSRYGKQANWTDNYVDTRSLAGSFYGLDGTKLFLQNGYNIDVTPTADPDPCRQFLDDSPANWMGVWGCRHNRPYRFYGVSVDPSFVGDAPSMAYDPINGTGAMGYPLSLENGHSLSTLNNIYPKGAKCVMSGGICYAGSLPPSVWTFLPGAVAGTVVDAVAGTINYVAGVGATLFNSLRLGAISLLPGSVTPGRMTPSATPTESPSWITVQATTTQPVNILRFNWRFAAAGEGFLRVFVDDVLVREIDQRHVSLASLTTEEIYIGGGALTLAPGIHRIAFRLDGFGTSASGVELTGVELGLTSFTTPGGGSFYTVSPCRILDTRTGSGFPAGYGPPSIAGNHTQRTFVIAGQCGIPAGAGAVLINATVWAPTTLGDLRVFPAGVATPLVSTLNWEPNILALANAALVPLSGTGAITVQVDGPGTVDIFFDVNGYFQ